MMANINKNQQIHKPVLVSEIKKAFNLQAHSNKNIVNRKNKFIDATVGLGGHTIEILKSGNDVLGIDADEQFLEIAREKIEKACPPSLSREAGSYTLIHGNFRDLKKIATSSDFDKVDGIIFDLGVSTPQLTSSLRGFSFQNPDAKLDMRLSTDQEVSGFDLLNFLALKELQHLFEVTLPSPVAKKLAKNISERRKRIKFNNVEDFLYVINQTLHPHKKLNIATLPFLALRIAVNSELDSLIQALPQAIELLKPNGRLVVISFHSGEDKIVKKIFLEAEIKGEANIIYKKPILPTVKEIAGNPKARSAKMRVLEKI